MTRLGPPEFKSTMRFCSLPKNHLGPHRCRRRKQLKLEQLKLDLLAHSAPDSQED